MGIYKEKTVLMQRICKLVGNGYTRHTSGQVSIEKADGLFWKFSQRYGTQLNRSTNCRRYKKGYAKSKMLMYFCPHDRRVHWWLLVSEFGEGDVCRLENLKDTRDKHHRINISAPLKCFGQYGSPPCYEIVRRRRQKRQGESKRLTWTWQYDAETMDTLQHEVSTYCRRVRLIDDEIKYDHHLRALIGSIQNTRGFHASRRQAYSLIALAKKRWKHSQKIDWPYETRFIPFVGRYRTAPLYSAEYFQSRIRRTVEVSDVQSVVAC